MILWDLTAPKGDEAIWKKRGINCQSMVLCSEKNIILSGTEYGNLGIWDINKNKKREIKKHRNRIEFVASSVIPDDNEKNNYEKKDTKERIEFLKDSQDLDVKQFLVKLKSLNSCNNIVVPILFTCEN